ncbi:MAG TPA: molecular chaperone [Pseudolabrys sp.]|nr:molecular chaperone [Pseudolabrys sp.]
MRILTLLFALSLLGVDGADAASLRVSPVLLDVRSPGAVAGLTLRNDERRPITAQLRVFRWVQDKGTDRLEPTGDVVVSPPIMTLTPQTEYHVRIIRLSRRPADKEESYRLLVDELPDAKSQRSGAITFVVRQSIPIFFGPADAETAGLEWSVARDRHGYRITGINRGGKRLRIATLQLRDGRGAVVARRNGLVGYVLGHSQMSWRIPALPGGTHAVARISAETEAGPINVATALHQSR